ncbi:Putative LOC100123278 [Caligus rogercresseyi]|uniref:LOC100123278 n=1 Tax=Caligus rogercresseyi TaxID=217165 RepID=A0A7T8JWB3_CALRO|nr:Putative LOC100123278 [Caligus rogercresseyi]
MSVALVHLFLCALDSRVHRIAPLRHNMSVMGSQLEIDMDPEGDAAVIPRHQGHTGTGCYRLFDHRLEETAISGQ